MISTRATKVQNDTVPTKSALRELAKLEGHLNPEASTIADRIRETATEAGGETSNDLPKGAAPAFTLVDRFSGDIGTYAECGFSASEIDPSRHKDTFKIPPTYEGAWNHEDPFQREKWRAAITLELNKMEEKGVWKKIKRADMESGRRCVKHKWVNDIKQTGRFHSRLVACGYSQTPGIDYQGHEVYSPVINDITF